jgi:N-carbamoyl-L-amino-acid hydrolase
MVQVLARPAAGPAGLIRAHPELAGKAMVAKTLTAESTNEQNKAGLTDCTPEEFARIQQLNADYNARFGFPFILAVRGPRGLGLSKAEIIDTFARRLPTTRTSSGPRPAQHPPHRRDPPERQVRLRAHAGQRCLGLAGKAGPAQRPGLCRKGQLTVTYLTDAHRACAQRISHWMRDCGFDEVEIDAVGNVVGRYQPATPEAKTC